ncbi:hypothetical protein Tco_1050994, partial [Tanacetum coccineum]
MPINNLNWFLTQLATGFIDIHIGALRSPRRKLRNELKYVQSGVKMNEISCLKIGYAPSPNFYSVLHTLKKICSLMGKEERKNTTPIPIHRSFVSHLVLNMQFNGEGIKEDMQFNGEGRKVGKK